MIPTLILLWIVIGFRMAYCDAMFHYPYADRGELFDERVNSVGYLFVWPICVVGWLLGTVRFPGFFKIKCNYLPRTHPKSYMVCHVMGRAHFWTRPQYGYKYITYQQSCELYRIINQC